MDSIILYKRRQEGMQKPANVDDSLTDYNLAGNSRPFMDSVSGMHWMPATQNNQYPGNMVAVTTWDGSLRVLEVVPNGGSGTIQEKYYIDNLTPITCFTWNSDTNTSITFGCVDGSIKNLDLTNNSITQIGKCNDIVHSVHYIPSSNTILSVGYDKVLNFWQRNNPQPVFIQTNNNKIYVSDYSNGIFAAGTDDEKIMIFDVANMNNFPKPSVSESYLQKKSQLSCMSLSHDASLVSYGSIDGRGNVSSIKKGGFSSGHSLSSEIIFKANKYTINSVNYVYPVNAIGLNVKN